MHIVEFLTTQQLSIELSKDKRMKIRVNSRYFVVIGNRLYCRSVDGMLRKCVTIKEIPTILVACYDSACGGHFCSTLTSQKILRARYY